MHLTNNLCRVATSLGARDLLGLNTNIVLWNLVETGAAITAACLPTLRPLLQGFSPESVIGNILLALSLRSQARSNTNQGYSDAALQGDSMDL
ncbi:hypothetical protein BJ875DRAFT_466319 [Amylocarpus encephaloides]|uniref:Uncharacterized protein n=1 Tax=Amylocarpus encephaloides TaxID=45428 RepID=A0A9P7YG52_9HELO|nr:hypothetical protein BJ875DRAFT_466319 [Amylocarpus encephaloides]